MTSKAEIKAKAQQYPGSYQILDEGKVMINNRSVSFLLYTNPNNASDAAYVVYKARGDKMWGTTTIHGDDVVSALENLIKE